MLKNSSTASESQNKNDLVMQIKILKEENQRLQTRVNELIHRKSDDAISSQNSMSKDRYSYFFYLTKEDEKYIRYARNLVNSLRCVGTKYEISALLLPTASKKLSRLIASWNVHIVQEPYPLNFSVLPVASKPLDHADHIKLVMWKQIQYKKIVFLDVDSLILNNPDYLFFTKREFLGKAVNTCPINNGVLVFTPNLERYADMLRVYSTTPFRPYPGSGWNGTGIWTFPEWFEDPRDRTWSYSYKTSGLASTQGFFRYYFDNVLKIWLPWLDSRVNYFVTIHSLRLPFDVRLSEVVQFHFTTCKQPYFDNNFDIPSDVTDYLLLCKFLGKYYYEYDNFLTNTTSRDKCDFPKPDFKTTFNQYGFTKTHYS